MYDPLLKKENNLAGIILLTSTFFLANDGNIN